VQADLRCPPFPAESFDLVYSFGVVHHVADPAAAVRTLAALVRPGGALRLYVYRSLADEVLVRRALLGAVTAVRSLTTRLPPSALHAFSWAVSAVAQAAFLVPRRALRRWSFGDRLTRGLPLVQYADVPFRMLVAEQFDRFGLAPPSIAVAAVNPHAGEDGMFGREDQEILTPAVEQCSKDGIRVSGPHSADSLYYRAHSGEFDVVIAPYHDQGLAPLKLIAHGQSTNVTLGLPYVRTSPDHGTALSIAGKGLADPSGMISAMRCAVDLCGRVS